MESALLLHQNLDQSETNHKKSKEECNELVGKGITGFHFFYFLHHLNQNKISQNFGFKIQKKLVQCIV